VKNEMLTSMNKDERLSVCISLMCSKEIEDMIIMIIRSVRQSIDGLAPCLKFSFFYIKIPIIITKQMFHLKRISSYSICILSVMLAKCQICR
jgi:hypothetical protein